jgi:hypothetical protein
MADQHQVVALLLEQGKAISAMQQQLKDNGDALFGAPGRTGVLKYLADKDTELASSIAAASTRIEAVGKEVEAARTDFKIKKAYVIGYASACGTFFGIAAAWLKTKFSVHP